MRNGADVTDPVLSDGAAAYTPGISERRSSATSYAHQDQLGSVTRLTDSSQATTATKTYDAFGNLVASTGATSTPFGFAGGEGYQSDADSGLMLLGHRYYDPSTGRFLTRDPARDGRNWYGYCNNNPLSCTDPTGMLPEWVLRVVLLLLAGWQNWVTGSPSLRPGGGPTQKVEYGQTIAPKDESDSGSGTGSGDGGGAGSGGGSNNSGAPQHPSVAPCQLTDGGYIKAPPEGFDWGTLGISVLASTVIVLTGGAVIEIGGVLVEAAAVGEGTIAVGTGGGLTVVEGGATEAASAGLSAAA